MAHSLLHKKSLLQGLDACYRPKIFVATQGDKTQVNKDVDVGWNVENVGESLFALSRPISYLRFDLIL